MRILIIDEVQSLLADGLLAAGHTVDYRPEWDRHQLILHLHGYEGLIVRTKTDIDKEVLLHADELRFIGRAGAGLDNIDTAFCDLKGIRYFNAGEANADAVGEQTLAMLLGLFAKVIKADDEVRKGIWDREGNRGLELKGKTVGIIGYGNTGKAVAQKLKGFGVKVLAYDKYLIGYGDEFAEEATMDQVFEKSDVVSFHVPLTDETRYLGNRNYFNRFRNKICLLNLSRGKVVNLSDLVFLLKEGKVWSAALDVLENERIGNLNPEEQGVFDYLRNASNVVLTPHIGGWTTESFQKISEVLLRKIKQLTESEQRVKI